jgi:hypothetical protein
MTVLRIILADLQNKQAKFGPLFSRKEVQILMYDIKQLPTSIETFHRMTIECINILASCRLLWIKAKFCEGKVSTAERKEVAICIVQILPKTLEHYGSKQSGATIFGKKGRI